MIPASEIDAHVAIIPALPGYFYVTLAFDDLNPDCEPELIKQEIIAWRIVTDKYDARVIRGRAARDSIYSGAEPIGIEIFLGNEPSGILTPDGRIVVREVEIHDSVNEWIAAAQKEWQELSPEQQKKRV